MTGGEEEQKKGEGKGFAGLSSLVSDVDTPPPPSAAKKEPAAAAPSAGRSAPQPAQPQPSQRQTYQEPVQPSSGGSSGGKWVLGIVAIIGVLWLIGQSDKSPTSPTPAYSPPAQSATPSYSPPAKPQAPSRPQESMPPVGQDLVFSTAQIRYCLAEDIRMEGAKSALNNYIDSDVDRFNAMVADYNSRCGSFRYRSGALESARRDIEPYRSQLQSEGRSRFARPSTGSLSTPAPSRVALDVTVEAIQHKLNELGYKAGTADGLMGRGTRSAILEFQRDMGLTQDGQPDRDLLAALNSATSVTTKSITPSPNRDYAPAERSAALPSIPAPEPLRPRQVQTAPANRDVKNFSVCASGQYPSLCNYALLTPDEKVQVAAAERRVNFQTCASGNYPSLCKRSLLTPEEATQVAAAERRVNLQTCISGNYRSLCKRNLLTPDETAQVAAAERRVNFQTCISGNYPSLCKHSLLASDEAVQVASAERRVNYQTCISGQYPSLCKHSLLTSDEAARVADAERRAGNR